jgi:hypothetical protein
VSRRPPPRQSQGCRSRHTFGTDPVHDTAPITSGLRGVPPDPPSPCTGAYPMHDASDPSAPSAPKVCILRDLRGWEPRLQNNTHIIRATSVLSPNPYCILGKNPFSSVARNWQLGRPWRNRVTLPNVIFPNTALVPTISVSAERFDGLLRPPPLAPRLGLARGLCT